MHHPAIFAIPPLMLLDYFLTVLGARLAEPEYRKRFAFPDYELNPLFRKQIAKKRWFNPLHLAFVIVFFAACIFWYENWLGDDPFNEAILGAVLTVFSTITGSHLSNIFLFRFLNRHPQEASGQVVMSQRFILNLTRYRMLPVIFPLAVAACFVRMPFLYGAVAGASALFIAQTIWLLRERKKNDSISPSQQKVD
jgi:hypothetical protein